MTHPRALTEQEAIEAERWYQEYERVGTIRGKARELGIDPHTLYDAIRRIRGQDTRVIREKLHTFHMERTTTVEEEIDKSS